MLRLFRAAAVIALVLFANGLTRGADRPNILLAISDDQSWPHAGAYGCQYVRTPVFDRIAREGVLFTHAFCAAPQCSPSRSALLTGRNIWQLEEAGTHASVMPRKFAVYPELLEQAGYHVGCTGKAWGPGNWKNTGWPHNPAGVGYDQRTLNPPTSEVSREDYAANFQDFLDKRSPDQPFCFWFGCHEPHRDYEQGSGIEAGLTLNSEEIPSFLPANEVVLSDVLDYVLEIEWFDEQLGRMVDAVEQMGELDNTILVVTSDNGMPFPHAKAMLYDSGTRVPLAIRWGDRAKRGRVVNDLVSLIDLAPTFLEATGVRTPSAMTGRSLVEVLTSDRMNENDVQRSRVFLGRERHNHARADNLGFPSRAIRTRQYLYIHNFTPDRWPCGDPPNFYDHTKMANPTKDFLLGHQDDPNVGVLFQLTYGRRPAEELYDMSEDPSCLRNLAADPKLVGVVRGLRAELMQVLADQGDPRVLGYGDIFDSYPHFGRFQSELPGFKALGKYNPKLKEQAEAALRELHDRRTANERQP